MAMTQPPVLEPSQPVDEAAEPSASVVAARPIMELLFGPVNERNFAVRFWDGTVDRPPAAAGEPRFTLAFRSPGSVRRAFLPLSEIRLVEAFLRGDIDVEGAVEQAAPLGDLMRARVGSIAALARLAAHVRRFTAAHAAAEPRRRRPVALRLMPRHSRQRTAATIRAHYDVGNDFYALWLDRRLVYSCAYFETGTEDLDTAQEAKLEHICRKLRLRSDERLLDIGCGWGGLIRYAAERYGVTALGVTLSPSQATVATDLIARDGLAHRCTVEVRDYRDVRGDESFDKIVSVGMVEHVGARQLRRYFKHAWRLLKPRGLFLNHGIVRRQSVEPRLKRWFERAVWGRGKFIDRYVFPDGQLVNVDYTLRCAEEAGFEPRDLESLREHYALTLRHWTQRLESAAAQAITEVGEDTYRVWRLYMSASAHGFATGRLNIVQALLAKPDARGTVDIPLTRRDLYALQP